MRSEQKLLKQQPRQRRKKDKHVRQIKRSNMQNSRRKQRLIQNKDM